MSELFKGRVALVTGASRGIGRAAALALAAAGAHVVAVARTVGGLEELDDEIQAKGGTASLVPLDLKDGDGLDNLGFQLFERYGRLDILVGNAGILGSVSPLGHIEPRDWDNVMAVNLTANWRLIRAMDPLLRRSEAGRALFVTSGAAWKAAAYWGPYAVSKAGLDTLVRTYAHETENTAVRANLLSPGPIRTRMRAAAMPGEDPETLPPPEAVTPAVLRLTGPDFGETGKVFDLREGRVLAFRGPA
ncbi:SDR family NAD(P)-dependent oxidoreductase [Labrys wisconsinensis]|uniref:NAD(P)-dependent dehydrogenase (Short-subunit alcohol dehydrogenase family) n=1 Tax=Labrys wisconsinensis TaxID=425677 RepID=A0ABU0J6H5_9HYPH|nr:SDR family NAD(P)-dependent oxidoreductase [Labrys wisconsinensis]MDQ0469063.1 NAD(P)-dependent dehydrogenase (short-subunit alcohol dehydrogenase family) [Labrys wisconsinensis]